MSASDKNSFKFVSSFLNIDKNPEDNWSVVDSIGDGAFGKIYKMQHKESNKFAALKQVTVDNEDNIEEFCYEVKVLCQIKHRNIVELFEAYYYASKIWMFLEYCQIGSVDSVMQELERPLDEAQISCILYQLCQALTYLHCDLCIIHRDIKTANVLLTSDASIKLADFGVSAICKNGARRNSFIGSPYWMAPEVINCETNKDDSYDFMADIWSLGIMSIEMAQMDPPWNEVNPSRVTLKILRNAPPFLDDPDKWSQMFKDFIGCCLRKEPKERLPAAALSEHKFLTSTGGSPGPLKALIAEVTAEVVVETTEIEEEEEENDKIMQERASADNIHDIDGLAKEYLPNVIISTNIDEELAKHSHDAPHHSKPPLSPVTMTIPRPNYVISPAAFDHAQKDNFKNPRKPVMDDVDKHVTISYEFSGQPLANNQENISSEKDEVTDKARKHEWKESQVTPRHDNSLVSNENFSFGGSSLGSVSSKYLANLSSFGKVSKFTKKKVKQQSEGFKEGLKVGLFGALASKQRLIGRSEEEGRALDLYRGARRSVFSNDKSFAHHQDDEENDGDISSAAMTINHEADEEDFGRPSHMSLHDGGFKREKARYKSLTKIRTYTYEGQPMTSRMSKVIRHGQEDRSRRERHNKKMDMRAMQLLQMTENRHYQNLIHHFKKQKRDLIRNFQANIKKCLKCYAEDLDRLIRAHKQSIIKLQLQHDQEFNEVIRRVKVQQEKDHRSLQSMLRMELKNLKENCFVERMDRKSAKTAISRKESENIEALRTYSLQQRDQVARLIDQMRFKHRVQQGNMENNFLAQKHDLYRACEGSIWKLEEHHLSQKYQLIIEQHKQMYDLQVERARVRHLQDIEQLTRTQKLNHSELSRRLEEEEKILSKILMQQRRQRIYMFKEALKLKNLGPPKDYSTNVGFVNKKNDVLEDVGGDTSYMSLEKKQIEGFERNERLQMDGMFRSYCLKLRQEEQAFEQQCHQDVQELKRAFQERLKRLNLALDERLREEEIKDRKERAMWQQSLSERKKILEEELERQKNEQERFFRNVLRSSASNQDPDKQYFEKYDRNFKCRECRTFVLDANNYQRPSESKSFSINRGQPSPYNEALGAGGQTYWKEAEDQPINKRLISNSQMYKSAPNFISYWSGFDEDNFSNYGGDHSYDGDEMDSGYSHGFNGHKNPETNKFAVRFVNRSDDEISTIL